jgi:hypothetical protein
MLHPRNSPADAPIATVIEYTYKLVYEAAYIRAIGFGIQAMFTFARDCGEY